MTGLDKILEHIKQDAQQEADRLMTEAKTETDSLLAVADEDENRLRTQADEKRNTQVLLTLERGKSAAALAHRKLLLEAKQEIIADMMEAAKQSLQELPEKEYFETILKMVARYRLLQEGEIMFSKKDLSRVPASFAAALKEYSLTVSKETREINGGFVLLYGDIEENCSFDALFFEAKDELADKIRDLLFA